MRSLVRYHAVRKLGGTGGDAVRRHCVSATSLITSSSLWRGECLRPLVSKEERCARPRALSELLAVVDRAAVKAVRNRRRADAAASDQAPRPTT